ncbi:uncharacterized protein LOC143623397 [Bidens hawaiensis]|uniref:uncharacterized protein LOC143623397 n=1 Tax=Bidens hawaiensis TaxID=980011 RepID=UPI004049EAB6
MGLNLKSFFVKEVGKGNHTRFWMDAWLCRFSLKEVFPDLYKLEAIKGCLVHDRVCVNGQGVVNLVWAWSKLNLSQENLIDIEDLKEMVVCFSFHHGKDDRWKWLKNSSGIFSVQSLRRCMADHLYGDGSPIGTWESWIPIKINCFIWRLLQKWIPVAVNLIARGLNSIPSVCSMCNLTAESTVHVFLE